MHEFKHGQLKSGSGGKVKNPRQAIAIGLSEAGASNQKSGKENRRNLDRTKKKEKRGETAQQEKEGKSHLGASGRRESSKAMGGDNATNTSRRRARRQTSHKKVSRSQNRAGPSKQDLYDRVRKKNISGRSKMSKEELKEALQKAH